jgi:hypothetical protein
VLVGCDRPLGCMDGSHSMRWFSWTQVDAAVPRPALVPVNPGIAAALIAA